MNLRYLLDEHFRGRLWRAIQGHNNRGVYALDVERVGDPVDLPLGSGDPAILLWAEREQRILVTHDPDTMPTHLAAHLHAGHHSPGVFMVRARSKVERILSFLVAAAYASDSADWQDCVTFIP